MTRRAALLLALVLGPASGASPQGAPPGPREAPELPGARRVHVEPGPRREAEAARLREEADDLRRRLAATDASRQSLLEQARRLDQQLALSRAEAEGSALAAGAEAEAAAVARARAESLAGRVAALRRRAALVARALYVEGRDAPLVRALLGKSSTAQVGSALVEREAGLALDLRQAEAAALAAAGEASGRAESARRLAQDAEARRVDLQRQVSQRQVALRRLSAAIAADRDAAEERERAAQELLGDLTSRSPAARPPAAPTLAAAGDTGLPGLETKRGRLPWPIAGRPRVLERWGPVVDPVRGTRTFRHGVAIDAARGATIRAVADGRVLFVDWYKAFGRCLVLDHGDGFLTVYAHADAFSARPGDDVRAGDAIGEAGDTGSLDGPRLWFQVQRRGESVDPLEWLQR